jgi:hypothetical protein
MTTGSGNPNTKPQVLQTYTLLQIAAEAMFGKEHNQDAASAGSGAVLKPTLGIDGAVLFKGNSHSSRFTTQQAIDFAADCANSANSGSGLKRQIRHKFGVRSQIYSPRPPANSGSGLKYIAPDLQMH